MGFFMLCQPVGTLTLEGRTQLKPRDEETQGLKAGGGGGAAKRRQPSTNPSGPGRA